MKTSDFKPGTFLYKLGNAPDAHYNNEGERVFIHSGFITGDGYTQLLGFVDSILYKSTGYRNFCYGADVREATNDEIIAFINSVHNYDKPIINY
jgi:hypothetical protein